MFAWIVGIFNATFMSFGSVTMLRMQKMTKEYRVWGLHHRSAKRWEEASYPAPSAGCFDHYQYKAHYLLYHHARVCEVQTASSSGEIYDVSASAAIHACIFRRFFLVFKKPAHARKCHSGNRYVKLLLIPVNYTIIPRIFGGWCFYHLL